ncbi:MAG: DNA replication/repair protein RecF [Ectothiorhodospiraceae bacterium]|nr:DNA replication/repair protein RecF [Chromatiales bacterium]MCP5156502.1 DNA replication/repair protein RecF [Ectothiorhodospiraceae bacterium]
MHLLQLDVADVRSVQQARLMPSRGLNVLFGPNGAGKTSILEAVHVLGTGRSFRTRRAGDLVRRGCDRLTVHGVVAGEAGKRRSIGVELGQGAPRIRVDGEDVRAASSLARLLPMVLVTPESHRVLNDGAAERRQLVDWAMFHVEPAYSEAHQRYLRALRQRNILLREGRGIRELAPWTDELVAGGQRVAELRSLHLEHLLPAFSSYLEALMAVPVCVQFAQGWKGSLAAALEDSLDGDRARGFTGVGPHRADLRCTVDGREARHVLSRGEGKLFVVGLHLAQADYLARTREEVPLVMLDDLASELDEDSRRRVLDAVHSLSAQTFITTVDRELVGPTPGQTMAVFHVEQGQITPVI